MNLQRALALTVFLTASPVCWLTRGIWPGCENLRTGAGREEVGKAPLAPSHSHNVASGGWTRNGAERTSAGARPESLCYAFLLNGDLYLACGGKTTRLIDRGDLVDFAIDGSGTMLATISQVNQHRELTSYFLRGPRRKPLVSHDPNEAYAVLHPTCGTIVAFYWGRATDIEAGRSLAFAPYSDFRCSSDRRTVVGMMKSSYALLSGFPPHKLVPGGRNPSGPGVFDFSLSESGLTVAYDTLEGDLCLLRLKGGPPSCIRRWSMGGWTGRTSVSDTEGAIFTDETGQVQPCYYDTLGHASRHPKPGYSADACSAVYWWAWGKGKPKMLQYLAILPQWVTPQAAARLTAWSARTSHVK